MKAGEGNRREKIKPKAYGLRQKKAAKSSRKQPKENGRKQKKAAKSRKQEKTIERRAE